MKVLAISSSPRLHGNSDLLCDQFLKGAAEAGHSVEKSVWQRSLNLPALPVTDASPMLYVGLR